MINYFYNKSRKNEIQFPTSIYLRTYFSLFHYIYSNKDNISDQITKPLTHYPTFDSLYPQYVAVRNCLFNYCHIVHTECIDNKQMVRIRSQLPQTLSWKQSSCGSRICPFLAIQVCLYWKENKSDIRVFPILY